jgi:glycolate oxidase FAD binding subunit
VTSATDQGQALAEQIAAATATKTPLAIRGGGSKECLAEPLTGQALDVTGHRGIVSYEPGELVLTARAGTPLAEIEAVLAESGQMLAFEPPHYGRQATLGGTIAAGISGPARPFMGAARDFVLGVQTINGHGEILRFGGKVMKNVAGYDLARFMAGAHGTLGVLLEISLKVLPQPRSQQTQVFEQSQSQVLARCAAWGRRPWPLTAVYWEAGRTYLRLAGAAASVAAAVQEVGGETLAEDAAFWQGVREQQRDFFGGKAPLWRLSLPPATPVLAIDGDWAVDWGGAQRWLRSAAKPETIRAVAAEQGGHASIRRGPGSPRLHPLPAALMRMHQRIKRSFDPEGIFNRGRLYPDF